MNEYNQHVEAAYGAALQAGAEILEVYAEEDFGIEHKADDSPLTRADRRAHEIIVRELSSTGLPLLSEEGAKIPPGERQKWALYWLIDPLDGTKEFIKRNGEFTVNIALMAPADLKDGKNANSPYHAPIAGVVYVPVKDIAYVGLKDQGAWKIEGARKIEATSKSPFEGMKNTGLELPIGDPWSRPFSAVMSRSHNSPETEACVADLEASFGPAERVSSGSSIKLCLVAEGTADVYPRFAPTMEWDTAAGDAICRAAGCSVTEQDGRTPLRYNKEDLHNPWFLVQGPRILQKKL